MSELVAKKSNKKWILFVVTGVVLVVAIVAAIFFISHAVKITRLKSELNAAEKYYGDLDYKEAIAHYKEAIAIDPGNLEAYIGIAEAYDALAAQAVADMNFSQAIRYYKDAISILKDGAEYVDSDEIDSWLDRFRDKKKEAEELQDASASGDTDTSDGNNTTDNTTGGAGEADTVIDENPEVWKELYLTELQNNYGYYSRYTDGTDDYSVVKVALCYVDGDAIPEMIVHETDGMWFYESFYTVKNGELCASRELIQMGYASDTYWTDGHILAPTRSAMSATEYIITIVDNYFVLAESLWSGSWIEDPSYASIYYRNILTGETVDHVYSYGEDYEIYLPETSFFRQQEYKDSGHNVETVNIDVMIEQLSQ